MVTLSVSVVSRPGGLYGGGTGRLNPFEKWEEEGDRCLVQCRDGPGNKAPTLPPTKGPPAVLEGRSHR